MQVIVPDSVRNGDQLIGWARENFTIDQWKKVETVVIKSRSPLANNLNQYVYSELRDKPYDNCRTFRGVKIIYN